MRSKKAQAPFDARPFLTGVRPSRGGEDASPILFRPAPPARFGPWRTGVFLEPVLPALAFTARRIVADPAR
jgi:hypothetical protein